MFRMAILAGAAAISLVPTTSSAQAQEATAESKLDGRKVVEDVRRILAANYVLPDVRPRLDAALAKGIAEGRYDVSEPAVLAERINADMGAVAHDKHLGISHDPPRQARLAAQPPGSGADDAPPSEEEIRQATNSNHGILKLEVLPGNIRYMELLGFFWGGKKTAEAYDNAMRFLRDGDAVVIDLRRNGGGSPDAVQYLISHFVEANRPIVTFHMGAETIDRRSSLASLPAGRLVGKPLYVLASGHSASAAEEFIGHVAGFKLGEVVGENSAGAGFRNEYFPVAGGYVISVSVGRAVLASTGKDWEGVGIPPTVKVAQDKALEAAQVRALRRLAASAMGEDKRVIEARAAVLEAKVTPIATALPLVRYAGTYGERSVTADGGKLIYRRQGGPTHEMIAVGPNDFTFENDPLTRVSFKVGGDGVSALELLRGDGSKVLAERTQ